MNYIAFTQPTADWLLAHAQYSTAVYAELRQLCSLAPLADTILVAGALRAAASREASLLCVWNVEYLSSTGAENWGVIRVASPMGLFDHEAILQEAFERCLYVLNQRLQGLLLNDERLFPRNVKDDVHTCLAGRGEAARQLSIAFAESTQVAGAAPLRNVICVGPGRNMNSLVSATQSERVSLDRLAAAANGVVSPARQRPALDASLFKSLRDRFQTGAIRTQAAEGPAEPVPALPDGVPVTDSFRTMDWSYAQWTEPGSILTPAQKRIIDGDILLRHPVRIVGAAGSGKSLVMQLLAMRRLLVAAQTESPLRVLYVVHNAAMANAMWNRFVILGAGPFLEEGALQQLHVSTLFEHSQQQIGVETRAVIDSDASETKAFQLSVVLDAMRRVLRERAADVAQSPLLSQVDANSLLSPMFAELLASEIGVAIKGHDLNDDPKRYIGSEQPFSRLHAVLTQVERSIVFDVFRKYQAELANGEVLDSDDVAITFLRQLRTPLWNMKRRRDGYDYVFVDETQLFNENERRLFALLTKGEVGHVPIALALDEAQEVRGATSAGFGLLGIPAIANENLEVVHRSTKSILRLAFYILQHTTDLFGPEFPDFTGTTTTIVPDEHNLAAVPSVVREPRSSRSFGKFVLRQVRALRRRNIRQIAVIIHTDRYWDEVHIAFVKEAKEQGALVVLTQRGQRIDPKKPVIVLTRPQMAGGQEFDAVVAVGLEQGVVPPRVEGQDGLAAAMEQQALREMYLSFTRARYRLVVAVSQGAAPNQLVADAVRAGLLVHGDTAE